MSDLIDRKICLSLNSAWQVIGIKTVRQAVRDLTSQTERIKPVALAMDISYGQDKNGKIDFSMIVSANPTKWDDWINLPVRDYDLWINTPRMVIRVPTVIITPHFSKMPMKLRRATRKGILERDRMICQYTGEKLTNSSATLDHVVPKSKGGKDEWLNLVTCNKEINRKKGNLLNSEIGLSLIRKPVAPLPIPISHLIRTAHRDHQFFIK
ncbi:MAG: HNH endonuclease [Nanoarchaeota archaeon]